MCCAEHAQRLPRVSGVNERGPSELFSFNGSMAGLPCLKKDWRWLLFQPNNSDDAEHLGRFCRVEGTGLTLISGIWGSGDFQQH